MQYCNIHSHRLTTHPEDLVIINQEPTDQPVELAGASFQSMGIHPWHIRNAEEQLQVLREALSSPSIVAIGEAGLDKSIETAMDIQQQVFLAQAHLANEANKPLIIHCVKAWDELIAAKKTIKPHVPWIVHGFRGNAIQADQLIDKGFWLSFGKYANPDAIKAAWPHIFAETDDSDSDIREIYQQISIALQLPINLVGMQLRENVRTVFSI